MLSRPVRGSMQPKRRRCHSGRMRECKGYLDAEPPMIVSTEYRNPPLRTDGRQGGISPFVSLFPTDRLSSSIIVHADA